MIINHVTYSVSNLEKSIDFYQKLFEKSPVAIGEALAYFALDGLWLALNYEEIKRIETYSHIAFFIDNLSALMEKLDKGNISYDLGRARNEAEGKVCICQGSRWPSN